MQILVHHDKHGDVYYRADTPELERWAFAQMFLSLDVIGAYDVDDLEGHDKEVYRMAKAGDHAAARALCKARADYEYEGFSLFGMREPETAGSREPETTQS